MALEVHKADVQYSPQPTSEADESYELCEFMLHVPVATMSNMTEEVLMLDSVPNLSHGELDHTKQCNFRSFS